MLDVPGKREEGEGQTAEEEAETGKEKSKYSQNRNVRRNSNFSESHVSKQGRLSDTVSTDKTVSSSVSESESSVGTVKMSFPR